MAVTPFKSSDNFNMAGFNEKITQADNTYVAKTGDSMTGALSMGNNKITDVASPVNDGDAVNKGYVDGKFYAGSYIGNGLYGALNANTLTFAFTPSIVFITGIGAKTYDTGTQTNGDGVIMVNPSGEANSAGFKLNVTWGENSVSYYSSQDVGAQANRNDYTYYYFAIGK